MSTSYNFDDAWDRIIKDLNDTIEKIEVAEAEYCENCFLWLTDKTNYNYCPDCGTKLRR